MVAVTAQHREMLDQVLQLFDITPDYDLNLMEEKQDLYSITTGVLNGMKGYWQRSSLSWFWYMVILPPLCSGLAAFTRGFRGHVEAGLRTRNKYSPYPENEPHPGGSPGGAAFCSTDTAGRIF